MRHTTRLFVLVTGALTATAPASGQQGAPAAPLERATPFDTTTPSASAIRMFAGCYALSLGAWSGQGAPGSYVAIPTRIRLDTVRVDRHQSETQRPAGSPATSEEREAERRPAWSPVGSDSLQVLAWSSGMSSVHLFLRRRAAGKLEGTARYFWDVIFRDPTTQRWLWERYPTAPAILAPAPCA